MYGTQNKTVRLFFPFVCFALEKSVRKPRVNYMHYGGLTGVCIKRFQNQKQNLWLGVFKKDPKMISKTIALYLYCVRGNLITQPSRERHMVLCFLTNAKNLLETIVKDKK